MRFPDHGLYCITDPRLGHGRSHAGQARLCLEGGATIIQLRDKQASYAELLPQAREMAQLCREHGALFIVNDAPRLAFDAGADGVHIGQDDLSAEDARRIVGAGKIVGLSTHSRAQVISSHNLPVDYIGFGPIFATQTKVTECGPLGAEELRWALSASAVPVVPIGGITRDNLPSLVACGARHAAVVSAVIAAEDVVAAARVLADLLG